MIAGFRAKFRKALVACKEKSKKKKEAKKYGQICLSQGRSQLQKFAVKPLFGSCFNRPVVRTEMVETV